MEIYKAFQAFRYEYQDNIIKRAEEILNELDEYISDKTYVTNLQLEQVDFSFINAEAFNPNRSLGFLGAVWQREIL